MTDESPKDWARRIGATVGAHKSPSPSPKEIPLPTTRHMSPQAWRRLYKSLTEGERADLARDLGAFLGLSREQVKELSFALVSFNWEAKTQA